MGMVQSKYGETAPEVTLEHNMVETRKIWGVGLMNHVYFFQKFVASVILEIVF